MNCPSCNHHMIEVEISGVKIDYCQDGCQGVYFDNFELKQLDETHEGSGSILEEILSQERQDDSRMEKMECPKCHIKMKRHKYAFDSDIYIDHCYSCNGIWLDKGELAAVRDQFRSDKQRTQNVETLISSVPDIGQEMARMEIERDKADARAKKRRGFFSFLNKIIPS
ncbi:zf-TFIIB domain-containing protein [bacterium]|nr:zf-TFIIB domain-containing protein [bacterium]